MAAGTRVQAAHLRSGVELLVPIGDATPGEVVGRELYLNFVSRQNTDVVPPHLPRDMPENLVTIVQFNLEHGVWQRFFYYAFQHDCIIFGQNSPPMRDRPTMLTEPLHHSDPSHEKVTSQRKI